MSNGLTVADLEMFGRLGILPDLLGRAGVSRVTDAEARFDYGITGECLCPACTLQRTGNPVPCLVCQPQRRQAWLAATRARNETNGREKSWIQ